MKGIGTFIDVGAIILGGSLGTLVSKTLPKRITQSVINGLGLISLMIGVRMTMQTHNELIAMVGLLVGFVIGSFVKLSEKIEILKRVVHNRLGVKNTNEAFQGFIMMSLVSCVGPVIIVGTIRDSLFGDIHLLLFKTIGDLFFSFSLAATFGIGVLISAPLVLLIQGGLTLLAGKLYFLLSETVVSELTAVGGLLVIAIGLDLIEVKKLRVIDMLPALVVTPVIVVILKGIGIV